MEYQLVLSLAPLGCLQDWLIANTLSFSECCGMLRSITRGISHLHTELRLGDQHKPCVAHRDINTRNVLVQADLSCCIADFGFALKVFGSKYEYKGEVAMAETKSINEVGTLRYMAPELLEGAVNLRDCETALTIGIFLAVQYCRTAKEKPEPEESPLAPSGPGYSSNLRNVDNMNLIGMLGSGKYGTVMKGLLHDQEVAVKIYPEEHHQYYVNERNIYALPLMECPALLSYFGNKLLMFDVYVLVFL